MAITTMVGARIHRREDPRLVRGHGRYTDDFVRPHTVYMSVVRSPHAHARIRTIDPAEAMKALGFVNRFGRGVLRAQEALEQNGNAPAEFQFDANYVLALIRALR